MEKQVPKEHYAFEKYVGISRWSSYYYQLSEIVKLPEISKMIEVGAGAPVLQKNLEIFRPDIAYRSVDIAEDLFPDIVGSATKIPVEDNSVDLAVAFQVLEHIPFEEFEKALGELGRVSRKYVVISLPHYGSLLQLLCKIPKLPKIAFMYKLPSLKRHTFDGQHYWEIGKRGYDLARIRACIEKHFVIRKEYTIFENSYHRFYVLEKRLSNTHE